jgi:cardiolipin synthase
MNGSMSRPRCVSGAVLSFVCLGALLGGCRGLPPGYPYRVGALNYGVDDPQFARTMGELFGPRLDGGNVVRTLNNGDEIFPAMLEAIRAARETITFETFIFYEGQIGGQFTDALEDRARAGVKVHLLVDAVGSTRIDKGYVRRLTDAGAEVQFYHPLRWFDLSSFAELNNRTHRKLLVVDGRVGFTGGVGVGDDWLGNAQDPQHWRETHYRIDGPAVAQLQAAFVDHWVETRGVVLHGEAYFPKMAPAGEQYAQLFKSSAEGGGSESMQLMYLMSFAAARRNIRIGTGYFVPDRPTIDSLLDARRRGVRVQVIVPGPYNDVPVSGQASRALWGDLLRAGVEFYEYQPTMYHCKLMVVDGRWSSIGSANVDNRSFRLNSEANLNVLDAAFAAEQVRIFEEDLTKCKRVTYEMWANRPGGEKLREKLAALLRWQL